MSQEQLRPVAESPIPSSQRSYLYPVGDASGNRGGSDRCNTPTKADMRLRKVTLQEQARPVAVSRIHSSQKGDINSGRGAGGNPGQKGGSGRRSTPTEADTSPEEVLRERRQPVLEPRSPSPQISDINLGRGTGRDPGQRSGNGRRSTPTKAPEEVLRGRPQPVLESRSPSSQIGDIKLGRDAGGNSGQRGGSGRCSTPTRADTSPEEVLREQPQPVVEPRSPQSSDINFREIAGASPGNKGGSDRCLAYVPPITMRRAYKETHGLIKEDEYHG